MRRACSENTGPTSPTSVTSGASPPRVSTPPPSPTSASSSSPGGSLVRISVGPGSASDSTAPAPGCGPSSPRSSARSGRSSCSSKTSRGSEAPGSIVSSGTFPNAGTMRSGTFYRLPQSAPRTSAKGSGSSPGTPHVCEYPTPSASAYGSSGNGTGNNIASRGRMSLETMARNNAWPSATVGDARSSGRHTTTTGVMHPGTSLTDAVRMWPTPCRRDGKGSRPEAHASQHGGLQLPDAVERFPTPPGSASSIPPPTPSTPPAAPAKSGPGRLGKPVLNPDWVERLMGIPVGWTLVPRIPGNATRRGRSTPPRPPSDDSAEK